MGCKILNKFTKILLEVSPLAFGTSFSSHTKLLNVETLKSAYRVIIKFR